MSMSPVRIHLAATLAALAAAASVTAFTTPAAAQAKNERLGARGQIIVGADRVSPLLSYSSTTTTVKQTLPSGVTVEQDTTVKDTRMALLWNGNPSVIYNIPRFALDV